MSRTSPIPTLDRLLTFANVAYENDAASLDVYGRPKRVELGRLKVWAARLPRDASDDLVRGEGLTDARVQRDRYVVRRTGFVFAVGETFLDEDGASRTVEGLQPVGRDLLEIMSRRVGP